MSEELELRLADGRPLCRARVAASFGRRLRGLMGAAELPAGRGLLLPSTSSVHTHFMRFPIDVVFLDADRRVLRLVPELRPWRLAAAKGAAAVLELAAGECARVGLAPGDVLTEL